MRIIRSSSVASVIVSLANDQPSPPQQIATRPHDAAAPDRMVRACSYVTRGNRRNPALAQAGGMVKRGLHRDGRRRRCRRGDGRGRRRCRACPCEAAGGAAGGGGGGGAGAGGGGRGGGAG